MEKRALAKSTSSADCLSKQGDLIFLLRKSHAPL
jgi:hypothetical protein